MVCSHCKIVINFVFETQEIKPISVELVEVELKNNINENQKSEIVKNLWAVYFDTIDEKN